MLQLNIITPDGTELSESVDMVVLPGVEGDFGIIEGHMALTAGLRGGCVAIFDGAMNPVRRFVIGGGIADIDGMLCRVLCEHIVELDANHQAPHDMAETVKSALRPYLADATTIRPYT